MIRRTDFVGTLFILFVASALHAQSTRPVAVVSFTKGKLNYVADKSGDRVPDFSYAGYRGGDVTIPNVPVRVVAAAPVEGDNTPRIQSAIDQVAAMPLGADGFRGAVLLGKGRFRIDGAIKLRASGVVLRGGGAGPDGTVLVASGIDRRTLIQIEGADDQKTSAPLSVADEYVPVNAIRFKMTDASKNLKKGDSIVIRRPSSKEWIDAMGMNDLGGDRHGPSWRPGSRDVVWDRVVTTVEGDTVSIDAPLTCAIDAKFGGGSVAKYDWPGRIGNVGVENLSCESEFDKNNPKDEEHAWFGVTIENAADAWVRQVNFRHFVGSAVAVWDSCKRVTVEDCKSTEPVGEVGGWRRNTFFTSGQQVLMQRLYSEDGRHDFAVGYAAAGPNVFSQCEALRTHGESGAIGSFACGTLFELVRIDGNELTLRNRMYQSGGTGWAAANSVLWNCSASVIECWRPPAAGQNWAFGTWGEFSGNGYYFGSNDSYDPDSLYYTQLAARIGADATQSRAQLLVVTTESSSSPKAEVAAELARISLKPMPKLSDFIDEAAKRNPIPTSSDEAVGLVERSRSVSQPETETPGLSVKNGWLVIGDSVITGTRAESPWWDVRPEELALTRYVPGRVGRGLTDDVHAVAREMVRTGKVAFEQHPPLWYDRRRDDHERIRRMDGDVVAPFYEWPYERSGSSETAYDGLSKWDLTKYNPWYFGRLKHFADVARANRLILINSAYMQHSIIEAGAHYCDFPWRTANNVNNTGFPEPVYYAGDKRVFIGNQFYDVTNPTRRELHRKYIRHLLDAFADKPNVIHLTSEEYTGPLEFVQFWFDTIGEWERETGKRPIIGISATKDVQDAILADPQRSPLVSVIDIKYWWYQANGEAYAPKGGLQLAPRQHAKLLLPKATSSEQIVRAVSEYRTKYPDKAVMYSAEGPGAEKDGWATLIAGGSIAGLRVRLDPQLAATIATLHPSRPPDWMKAALVLADDDHQNVIAYAEGTNAPGGYETRWVDQSTGKVSSGEPRHGGGASLVWFVKQ